MAREPEPMNPGRSFVQRLGDAFMDWRKRDYVDVTIQDYYPPGRSVPPPPNIPMPPVAPPAKPSRDSARTIRQAATTEGAARVYAAAYLAAAGRSIDYRRASAELAVLDFVRVLDREVER